MQKETRSIEQKARMDGARLFGVAPVQRFAGAPRGHHPRDFMPEAKSVLVFGLPVLKSVVNYQHFLQDSEIISGAFREEYLQRYFYQVSGYDVLNQRLEQIALTVSLALDDGGFSAVSFPTTYSGAYKEFQEKVPGHAGIFSMRHAAVRAGLGEFGLNNLVVTSEYGPRVRFNAVITSAQLQPTPLLTEKVCLGSSCEICIEQCNVGALTHGVPGISFTGDVAGAAPGDPWLDPVSRTDITACRTKRVKNFCYGKCIRVCPVGK